MNDPAEHSTLWIYTKSRNETSPDLPKIHGEKITCVDAFKELNESEYDELLQKIFNAKKIICT